MLVRHKCKECGSTNVVNITKKMLHKEIRRNEGGALLGDEMLEVEEFDVEPKHCLGCKALLEL
jgi:hypothetical protein